MATLEQLTPLALQALGENRSLIRSLKLKIGFSSSWQGHSIGRYLEKRGSEISISSPFPADLTQGFLIDAKTNLLDGNSPVRQDLSNVVGLCVTLISASWMGPEIRHRLLFERWSKRISGPVFVSVNSHHNPWHATYWVVQRGACERFGPIAGECDPRGMEATL